MSVPTCASTSSQCRAKFPCRQPRRARTRPTPTSALDSEAKLAGYAPCRSHAMDLPGRSWPYFTARLAKITGEPSVFLPVNLSCRSTRRAREQVGHEDLLPVRRAHLHRPRDDVVTERGVLDPLPLAVLVELTLVAILRLIGARHLTPGPGGGSYIAAFPRVSRSAASATTRGRRAPPAGLRGASAPLLEEERDAARRRSGRGGRGSTRRSPGRCRGPDSPPAISQSIPVRSRPSSGPSSGSALMKRTAAGTSRR